MCYNNFNCQLYKAIDTLILLQKIDMFNVN